MPLTSEGLVVQRYQESVDALKNLLRLKADPTLEIADDELLGQLVQCICEQQTKLNELTEIVFSSRDIDSAYGSQLDIIGALKDIERLPSSPSQGYQLFSGDADTVIPSNTIVENTTTKDRYATRVSYTISALSVVSGTLSVNTVTDSTIYSVSVSGTLYSIDSGVGATEDSILTALESDINSDVDAIVTAEKVGATLVLTSPTYSVFSLVFTTDLTFDAGTVLGYVYAQNTGPQSSAISSVTKIVTPVLGLDETINPYTYTVGSNRELDEDYRIRLKDPSTIVGKATVPAILAAVRNTTGVSYATLEYNNTMSMVGDLPQKSFHVIVDGGIDANIADTIFDVGGCSIYTYGTTEVVVVDEGQSHTIRFSRPTGQFIAVRVTYSLYDEETPPDGLETLIQQAVYGHINSLGIGVDVIPGRVMKPIYDTTSGVGDMTIEVQTIPSSGSTPSGTWSSNSIAIPSTQFAQSGLVDIIVVEN